MIDDDPTVVILDHFSGSISVISEGERLVFDISLSRALTAGETIDVPLSIGGTGVTTADWSLIAGTGFLNRPGVTLSGETTPTPQVRFAGAGTQSAILILTAADDDTAEGGGSETYTIALGPDGGGANGFDRATLNTNVGGGADPSSTTNSINVRVNDPPPVDVIITETDSGTTVAEAGGTDDYGMTLDTQPTADVTITATSGTPGTATVSGSLVFTSTNWNMAQTITVTGVNNAVDAANQAVTITHSAASTDARYNGRVLDPVTATVIDDEPTIVSLTRNGSGAVDEGGTVRFTIALSRALAAGETIFAPFLITGTGVTVGDWELVASGTGVTLGHASGFIFSFLNFAGEGAMSATLVLTPVNDGTAESDGSETYTIALGPNNSDASAGGFDISGSGTNVGGGADPSGSANSFDLRVNDPPPASVTITQTGGNTRPIEGGTTDNYGMTLDTQPTADVTITATSGTPTTATVNPGSLVFTSTNWNMAQSITVTGVDNDDDAVNQAVTISHAATSTDTDYNLTPASVTATVIDDDPTTVTLAGASGDITEGGTKEITVTLGRGLVNGETLPVPLTFGGSATPGTDYTVTGAAATGITYTGLGGAVGTVTFTGPASGTTATTATLTLSAVNAGVTVDIDLGTLDADSGTGLSGGAAGTDNLADFDIVTPGVTVTETGGDTTVAEAGGTDNYGIRLSTQPSGSVTITAESDTTSAATVTPTTLTFTTANWNAAQTFTVTGIDNNRDDAMNRRIATISHAAASTTDTNYVSSLDIDDVEATVTDEDVPVLTVSVEDGHTTIVEGGGTRTIVVASDIPIDGLVDFRSPIIPNRGNIAAVSTALTGETPTQTYGVVFATNSMDDPPGRTATTGIRAGTGFTLGDPSTVTLRLIDSDPTTVTLAGTAGNINEGASVEITVTLGRGLVMGEVLPVPLTLGGTATRGTDYTLTGTPANNIAYNIPDTGNVGTVTFTGPAPTTATLTLTVQTDTTSDATETIDIGLGTLDDTSGTDLEGGAAGTDSLTDFTIMEQPTIVLPPTLTVAEGDTDGVGYPVRLATEPTMSTTITVTGQTGTDLTLDTASLTFTTSNWDTAQMVTVTADADDDAATDMVTLTHTATGGNYATLTAVIRVSITDNDTAGVTITETGGTTRPIEGGTADNYGMTLDTPPIADVTITATSGTGATVNPGSLTFTSANWNMAQTITVTGADNNADAVDQAVTISHAATSTGDSTYNGLDLDDVTATVIDDEPTVVALARTGSTGAVGEGGTIGFTITLSRALASGEIIDVPLSISGTSVTTDDWSLALDSNASNTGVTLSSQATATPRVRISGSRIANLQLTAAADGMAEGGGEGSETYIIALGPNDATANGFDLATLDTNVGGGADPDSSANAFNVQVNDPPSASVTITETGGNTTVAEAGGTDNYGMVLSTQPTADVTITATSGTPTTATVSSSLVFTNTNWNMAQSITVTGLDNDDDAANQAVTITHAATSTDARYNLTPDPVTATVIDDEPTVVALARIDSTGAVGEGGTVGFTITLSRGLVSGEIIDVPLSISGTNVTTDDWSLAFDSSSSNTGVTLSGEATATPRVRIAGSRTANLQLTATADGIAEGGGEGSETYTIALGPNDASANGFDLATLGTNVGGGADPDSSANTFNVQVNDPPPPSTGVTISEARVTVAEPDGTDIYTLVLDTQPAGNVEITVESDTTSAATVAPLSLTFTASNWDTVQTVTVTGVNDNVGGNRTATISHSIESGDGDGAGYPDGLAIATVAVTVTDDDEPVASFAVASFTTNEGSGTYNVVVNLSPVPTANTTISYTVAGTATPGDDYTTLTGTVVASASASSVEIPVAITDDSTQQEGSETVILTLAAGSGYTVGTTGVHTLTIAENDTAPVGTGAMQAAQEAWLPRFGLTAVEHLLGGLDYRFSVADQPGLSGNVSGLSAGRALHGGGNATGTGYGLGTDGFGQGGGGDGLGAGSVDRLLNLSRTLSLRDMLRGSRFVHRGGENGVSVWGQASYSRYEDDQDGITVDGDVTTGLLGVDRDNGRTLLGLALSYSDGDGDWSGAAEQGELSSQLTSLLPYIRHNVTQRLQVWAAASYGRGELEQTLEQTSATMSTEHDIEQTSASAGVRGILLERPLEEGGLTLTLISDAALARIESDDADGMSGMSADTQRFRMGLEWSWQLPQADGGRLIPELELGMRYDGGDTSDGLGVELGGGISWQLPSKGLTIDLRGRRLLDHEAAERREWGVSGSLRYERQPGSAHGPSLSLRHEYGTAPASGGLDRLLSDSLSDALEEDSSQPGPASGRWSLEGEWGLALNDGATGIPYAGLSSSDSGHDLTLGWRLLSAPGNLDTELDVKALRRRDGEGKTNHGIGAQWKLHW